LNFSRSGISFLHPAVGYRKTWHRIIVPYGDRPLPFAKFGLGRVA
jgi:hypothetical protein